MYSDYKSIWLQKIVQLAFIGAEICVEVKKN